MSIYEQFKTMKEKDPSEYTLFDHLIMAVLWSEFCIGVLACCATIMLPGILKCYWLFLGFPVALVFTICIFETLEYLNTY